MSDWIEWKWTPEKPYPETLETRVWVKFDTGETDEDMRTSPVSYWGWDKQDYMNITHYRIASEEN